eukprot:scaffold127678_cov69-Phaeocystis_antarctica.AAC.6
MLERRVSLSWRTAVAPCRVLPTPARRGRPAASHDMASSSTACEAAALSHPGTTQKPAPDRSASAEAGSEGGQRSSASAVGWRSSSLMLPTSHTSSTREPTRCDGKFAS